MRVEYYDRLLCDGYEKEHNLEQVVHYYLNDKSQLERIKNLLTLLTNTVVSQLPESQRDAFLDDLSSIFDLSYIREVDS